MQALADVLLFMTIQLSLFAIHCACPTKSTWLTRYEASIVFALLHLQTEVCNRKGGYFFQVELQDPQTAQLRLLKTLHYLLASKSYSRFDVASKTTVAIKRLNI